MMLRKLSIRGKLIFTAMIASTVAILVACAAFFAYDLTALRDSMTTNLAAQASIVGENSIAALKFGDGHDASETLACLRAQSHIESACIRNQKGEVLATYSRSGDARTNFPQAVSTTQDIQRFNDGKLEAFHPIKHQGETIGVVYLRSDLDELHSRLWAYLLIIALVFAGSLAVALGLVSRLQKVVSAPILQLGHIAKQVSAQKNYSLRAQCDSDDELGQLTSCFNEMLEQIQQRDGQLQAHRANLENEVARRTEELKAALERAEMASKAKTNFLANMSHEIRTPMTAILGYSDMMLEPHRTLSDRHDCLQVIRRNAKHLMELINDILDISKIEAEKMSVERIACDVTGLLNDVLSMTRPRALDKGLNLRAQFTGLVPKTIQTDPLRLKQVLMNILGNAMKFTNRGEIIISVACEKTSAKNFLRIDVSDTGIGMNDEVLGRLFQAFSQADESTTRKYGGTGLGLAISQKLARLMGGEISVISQPGHGSTFTIRVDAGSLENVEFLSEFQESLLQAELTGAKDIKLNGRILLVEDGQDNQCLISMFLREAGAEVAIAENGKIAVDRLEHEKFDMVFMDMQMPVMDGYTAASLLRDRGFKTPIIALTAHAMSEDRAKCLAAGCTDYCTKPVEKDKLLTVADLYLRGGSATKLAVQPGPVVVPVPVSGPIKSTASQSGAMGQALANFVMRLPARVSTIQTQLDARDLEELRRTLHQLKGAGSGYGFPQITMLAASAEKAIKDQLAIAEIAAQTEQLIELIRRVEGYDKSKEEQPCLTQ